MNEKLKSEYYRDLPETLEKYEVFEEAIPYAAESLQGLEEMFIGFTMYLIV
ncbi:hypothetical protein [Acetobacterium wieringae]|uniref:hypothetical protein n=1 Tax=Acetobacterium wieringae TaxID=52694 RepID=UPI0026EC6982|nr:hypothetical protein [Acetobacterium wieringae]